MWSAATYRVSDFLLRIFIHFYFTKLCNDLLMFKSHCIVHKILVYKLIQVNVPGIHAFVCRTHDMRWRTSVENSSHENRSTRKQLTKGCISGGSAVNTRKKYHSAKTYNDVACSSRLITYDVRHIQRRKGSGYDLWYPVARVADLELWILQLFMVVFAASGRLPKTTAEVIIRVLMVFGNPGHKASNANLLLKGNCVATALPQIRVSSNSLTCTTQFDRHLFSAFCLVSLRLQSISIINRLKLYAALLFWITPTTSSSQKLQLKDNPVAFSKPIPHSHTVTIFTSSK